MKVLYIDDEQRTLNTFSSDHAKDGMSVETCLDARRVVSMLSARTRKELPDIIVMDLYATIDDFHSDEAIRTNRRETGSGCNCLTENTARGENAAEAWRRLGDWESGCAARRALHGGLETRFARRL